MKETSCTVIGQTRFLCAAFLCSEFKLEDVYSEENFGGKNICGNFFCVNLFMLITGEITKIKTRKNFTPQSIHNNLCNPFTLRLNEVGNI